MNDETFYPPAREAGPGCAGPQSLPEWLQQVVIFGFRPIQPKAAELM